MEKCLQSFKFTSLTLMFSYNYNNVENYVENYCKSLDLSTQIKIKFNHILISNIFYTLLFILSTVIKYKNPILLQLIIMFFHIFTYHITSIYFYLYL